MPPIQSSSSSRIQMILCISLPALSILSFFSWFSQLSLYTHSSNIMQPPPLLLLPTTTSTTLQQDDEKVVLQQESPSLNHTHPWVSFHNDTTTTPATWLVIQNALEQSGIVVRKDEDASRTNQTDNNEHHSPALWLTESILRDFEYLYQSGNSSSSTSSSTTVRMVGMETCRHYQQHIDWSDRFAAPAGMFNTGTNAMTQHLVANPFQGIPKTSLQKQFQVPWGKHGMANGHFNHTAVLPIVMVRDPYFWMQSMCKSPYQLHWKRKKRCPNLVVVEEKDNHAPADNLTMTYQVNLFNLKFDSLVDYWSAYYLQYYNATFPRLIVRYEDMLWNPRAILEAIATCMGTSLEDKNYHYVSEEAKSHGSGNGLVQAIRNSANLDLRKQSLTNQDMAYSRTHLDPVLMQTFRYRYIEEDTVTPSK